MGETVLLASGPRPRHRYWLSGAVIDSAIALPAVPHRHAAGRPDPIVFDLQATLAGPPVPDGAWDDRNHGVSIGKRPDGFVLHLSGCADFWIARRGSAVAGVPEEGCPEETLAQLFLDQVLPLVLHARGSFAFHASAVALAGRDLVAFLGNAGAGKSTMASSLVGRAPAPGEPADLLFSDDCLAVEAVGAGVIAHPSYSSTRLWPESAGALFSDRGALPLCSPRTAKLRAALPVAPNPMPLRRLYLIEAAEGAPTITRLPPSDALARLLGHLYRLDPRDRARLTGELDLLERVVSTVPVAALAYRRSFAELAAVRRAILSDLAG